MNGCDMVISIGGRTTNLLFLEGDKFFARTIPIAGHTITQQIARKFSIGQPEAEELKRRHGFVAKTDEDTGTEASGDVAKIVRNVMRRLYGEISRSISIYKAQQHGSDPVKIYLTGGTTIPTSNTTTCLSMASSSLLVISLTLMCSVSLSIATILAISRP